jgi:hypothetical protein
MTDTPVPFDMPPASAGFDARAGWVVQHLMVDLSEAKLNHAGAIVGNLGGESGLTAINERHPLLPGSRGGFGWGQWTGPRRVAFEKFCADHALAITSDEGNYRWLLDELRGGEHHALDQVLKTSTIEAATETFEAYYERPADLQAGLDDRIAYAKRAIAAALGLAHVDHFLGPARSAIPASSPAAASSRSFVTPADGSADQVGTPGRRRPPAHALHLAGGMGIGLALCDTLTWVLGPAVCGVLTGHSFVVPQDVSAGWVLLLAIPGAILLHRMPWLRTELGDKL